MARGKCEVDMISLAGVEGSPEHEVDVEWKEFLESYDQDGSILAAGGTIPRDLRRNTGSICVTARRWRIRAKRSVRNTACRN